MARIKVLYGPSRNIAWKHCMYELWHLDSKCHEGRKRRFVNYRPISVTGPSSFRRSTTSLFRNLV
jgi:hypothetical protein